MTEDPHTKLRSLKINSHPHASETSQSGFETYSQSSTKKMLEFERIPPTSTYLVTFTVKEISFIEDGLCRILLRAYVPKGYKANCRYALNQAANAFFEDMLD